MTPAALFNRAPTFGAEFNLRAAPVPTRLYCWQRALGNLERNQFIDFRFELPPPSPRLATLVRLACTGNRRLRGLFDRCKGGRCCWQLLAAAKEGCFGGPSSLVRSGSKSTVDRTRWCFGNTPENAGRAFSESSAFGTASLHGWRSSRHAGGDAQVGLSPFATRVIAFAQSAASSPDPPQGIRAVPAGKPVTGFWLPVTLEVGVAAGKGFPGRRRRPSQPLLRRGPPCSWSFRGVKSRAAAPLEPGGKARRAIAPGSAL